MPRPARKPPRERVEGWPEVESADPEVEVSRLLARSLREVLKVAGLTYRAAQRRTGVNHTSIGDIVRGQSWPDVETVARLEAGLGADLWPAGAAARLGTARLGAETVRRETER